MGRTSINPDVLGFLDAVSTRCRNAMTSAIEGGDIVINNLDDLKEVRDIDLLVLKNLGQVCIRELVCAARERGIKLHPTCERAVPENVSSGISRGALKALAALARARSAIADAEMWIKRASKEKRGM